MRVKVFTIELPMQQNPELQSRSNQIDHPMMRPVSADYRSDLFLQLVEASKDLCAVFSFDGQMTYSNDASRAFWRAAGRAPQTIYEWLSAGFGAEISKENLNAVLAGQAYEREVALLHSNDGSSEFFSLRIFRVTDEGTSHGGIALIGTNITERRRVEAMLKRSSKMATLGEMAGGIAHEINNPLGVILVRSQLLRRKATTGVAAPAECIDDLKKIEDTALRIAKIVQSLRSFSRDSTADPMVVVPLTQIVDDTLGLCADRVRAQNISLRVDVPASFKVRCRPSQISEVLLNLVQNSFDAVAGKSGAWVEVGCTERKGSASRIELTVTDSGEGISESVTRKMMEPFFTTKALNHGTGLGLSISKSLVELHGGELRYDSSSPNTRFVVELPQAV